MAVSLQRPKGTQDTLPKDTHRWQAVEGIARSVAHSFGFREIRTPMFEETGLYVRSVGDTSDVVTKEMYTVSSSGDKTFTLRPECTAGVVRAMLENGVMNEGFPQKVYYILPCFRHEKPQAGRLREFHQFGVEMFGSSSPYADAEIILLAGSLLKSLGITEVKLNLNSIGCRECRSDYHRALVEYFSEYKDRLCPTCLERLDKNPMRLLDCKSPVCQEIGRGAPLITDYLCGDCREHFTALTGLLDDAGVEYVLNPRIVRGLDYYTRTVFEFISDSIGAQGTICGGGRYDGLVSELGGQPTPALGFGAGIERLILAMTDKSPVFGEPPLVDVYLAPMTDSARSLSLKLCLELRALGLRAEYDILSRGVKAQLKYANKIGARFVIVLGESELEDGAAALKNMETGEERRVSLGDIAATCREEAGKYRSL